MLMNYSETVFFKRFFSLGSERNPFVLPMQITRRRGDIHSPAGHKARPLFTSTPAQMSIAVVQRCCVGARRDQLSVRRLTFPLQPAL